MSDRTFERKKTAASNFSNSSLVSSTTPTLANPTRGFGLTNNNVIQKATDVSTEQPEVQSADNGSLEQLTIQEKPLSHDISRISFRRPQAKLTVGEPGDQYEQEADWMANRVMGMPDNAPQVQRLEEDEKPVQMSSLAQSITPVVQRAFQGGENQTSGDLESRLHGSKGGGSPLAPEVQAFMEPRFGSKFNNVRVHTGDDAVQMSKDLGAQAFTHGSDVYFGEGKAPGNNELTAHELTHVVQQTGGIQRKCAACEEENNSLMRKEEKDSISTSKKITSLSLSQQITASPPMLARQNLGEMWDALVGVGPLDTVRVKRLADHALQSAQNTGLPGLHNGSADAWRHAYWNCIMTGALGKKKAKLIADNHEKHGGGPANENAMDYHNNEQGRECGGTSCDSCVTEKLNNGQLRVLNKEGEVVPSVSASREGQQQQYYNHY